MSAREQPQEPNEIPLVSKEEAIAEVRRWLETDGVDPDQIFTTSGEVTIRYGDLISQLEQETPDGELLRFAIARGRLIKQERARQVQALLQVSPRPARDEGSSS